MKPSLAGTLSRRSLFAGALAAATLFTGLLFMNPTARADLTEGRDYALVEKKDVPTSTSKKIEVIEFFSYGCPHCDEMHPHITQWSATLPANVEFVRVPVAFGRREWGMLSRAYYTLQNLGELKRLDTAVFDAVHRQRQPMFDEASLTAWAVKQGISAEKFRAEFNSERVNKAVMNAENLTRDLVIDGVPKIVVEKKYMVVASEARSYGDIFVVADQVIAKAAKEKPAKR